MNILSLDNSRRRIIGGALIMLWLASLAGAMAWFMRWETTPGPKATWAGAPPTAAKQWRILMVAHTMCPCTQASLEELRSILSATNVELRATIVFTGPGATATSTAPNVQLARSIPSADLAFCGESEAVTYYHAKVSGQTFLFDPTGKVRFSGGLTEVRGEIGPSASVDAINRILAGSAETFSAPTLGCALQTSQD